MKFVVAEIESIEPSTVYPEGSVWSYEWTLRTKAGEIYAHDDQRFARDFERQDGLHHFVLRVTGTYALESSNAPFKDQGDPLLYQGRLGELVHLDDMAGDFVFLKTEGSWNAPDFFAPYFLFETQHGIMLMRDSEIDAAHRARHASGDAVYVRTRGWLDLHGLLRGSSVDLDLH